MTTKDGDAYKSTLGTSCQTTQDWMARLKQLSDALVHCPTDSATRCELATLLEDVGQHEEALRNWKAVLTAEPNNLVARVGAARCRRWMGQSLQFPPEGI